MSPHPSLVPRGQDVAQISRCLLVRAEVDLLEVPRTLCRTPVGTAGRVASQLARLSGAPSIKGQGLLFPRRSAIPVHHVGLQARDPASVPWSLALAPSPRSGPTSPHHFPCSWAHFTVFLSLPTALGTGAYGPLFNSPPSPVSAASPHQGGDGFRGRDHVGPPPVWC